MPNWAPLACIAALFIAGHYLSLRAASGRVPDALGALVLEATAAVGLLVLFVIRPTSPVVTTTAGLGWSVVSGLCITGASVLLFGALRQGGPVSSTGPLVLGGGVALSALVAPLLFREPWTTRRALGVGLGLVAMVLLATERTPEGTTP